MVLQSAVVFESNGDSILGVGRVLVGAIFYSLLIYHIFQGLGKSDTLSMGNWITALVATEIVYAVAILANVFLIESVVLASSGVYVLGLALLAIHLTVLILHGQRRKESNA